VERTVPKVNRSAFLPTGALLRHFIAPKRGERGGERQVALQPPKRTLKLTRELSLFAAALQTRR